MQTTSRTTGFLSLLNRKQHRFVVMFFMTLAVFFISGQGWAAAPGGYDLLTAKEKGATGTADAKGNVTATYDESLRKDVLDCSYSVTAGSTVSIWAKSFPAELSEATANTVKIGVNSFKAEQASEITVALEIKGSAGVQSVPVRLKTGWATAQAKIDWAKVGTLSEVSYVIAPAANVTVAKGSLLLSLDFVKTAVAAPVPLAPVAVPSAVPQAAAEIVQKTAPAIPVAVAPVPVKEETRKYGTNVTGAAKGSVATTFDEVSEKDVLDFSYTIPAGTSIQLWTKNFPDGLDALKANVVKVGIRVPDQGQADQISIAAELKGSLNTQTLNIPVKSGWNSVLAGI